MENSNLIPANERTEEDRRRIAKMGGIKSGEVRKRKKTFKDIFDTLLEKKAPESLTEGLDEILEAYSDKITVAEAIAISQAAKAAQGDTKAAEFVRDTSGQKPVDKLMIADVDEDTINSVESYINAD